MSIRVVINGFGRIGRITLRNYLEKNDSNVEIVAINGIKDIENAVLNIKYDTIYGKLSNEIHTDGKYIVIDGRKILALNERNVEKLPWKELGVDIVIESTGKFTTGETAKSHIDAGARKVIISAPGKDIDGTFVVGVNHHEYDNENQHIISNASCTTNCLAPVCKVLLDEFGIEKGHMTTVHAYTNNQVLLDAVNKSDMRRSRGTAESIIPTTTGAAKAISKVIPEMEGLLTGMAMRVPVSSVSVVDLVVQLKKDVTLEEVNAALEKASAENMKGILGYSTDPLVSVDFRKEDCSSVVDALSTQINDGLVKIISWYDNEWGYSRRLLELAEHVAGKMQDRRDRSRKSA
ncbi:glyceraldehyde 3-phosphate dehydrogenase [Dethiosulfatibacter aminovorans DSM 17477]|uniref:Glyceraldehyde-3-phosphate dehydrogenase n=1 Tax=Dethiosulfatibacter aminovorans DSM 17477 TaxID=1121476 RepID=A0A1M6FMG4_9FIRM|nr:type I glyceraldehyde-3-phosphate dehydrogenase [Dethiosulfatibacter aminovorans]SHI98938.1 glyceraldehyde 3-phosphate dehydrogenase [Dethiosulfatibacter aminovorans DSM 17477]